MINCPHCSKELTGLVETKTMEERLSKSSEARRAAEEKAARLEALANRAAPLAAKANGYEADEDTLDTLRVRHEKAAKNGYAGDFAEWMSDAEGAARDTVAARFRVPSATTLTTTPAAPPPPPATPPKQEPKIPTTPTATATPTAPTPRYTQEQVQRMNQELIAKMQNASPEERAKLKAKVEENRALLAPQA